jgi:hypothetical protein
MSDSHGEMEVEVTPVERRLASSGRVSYASPTVIHETTRTRVVFVPFFVQRSDGTELAIKLVTYKKGESPVDWFMVEEKSLSLGEEAARNLLRALKQHVAVSAHTDDGDYIAIRVSNGTADVAALDPSVVASAVANILEQQDIAQHLLSKELSDELVSAFRTAIRLQELRSAVAKLREHLDGGVCDESVYQRWCEEHTWAFGNAYVVCDDVRDISTGDRIDLLLPTVIARFRDIVELKRPDMEVLNYDASHKNCYFSQHVSKAIGQCHRYLDVLHEEAAKGLRDHPEIVAYHPRAVIVIGRSHDWDEEKLRALHGLNRRMNGITVMTFDQLLLQGERLLAVLQKTPERTVAEEEVTDLEGFAVLDAGDIPF